MCTVADCVSELQLAALLLDRLFSTFLQQAPLPLSRLNYRSVSCQFLVQTMVQTMLEATWW